MARSKRFHNYFRRKQPKKHIHITRAHLDQFSESDIQRLIDHKDNFLKYYWDYHNELAYQRSKITDKIKESLLEATQKVFKFEKWQRTLKYQYANEPFSVSGSLIDPGGRFNIGNINVSQFPTFPALYLASDKNTAIQELLSQKIDSEQSNSRLDALDFALTSHASIAVVSMSGSIGSIINLKDPKGLKPFVNLIKDFKISDSLKKAARAIKEPEPILIQTVPKLIEALLHPNWRFWPMQFDVPVASQIFGQLVFEAGVKGILYTSKFTSKDCLAIFPQNFEESSFIQLDDEVPGGTKLVRLDMHTWKYVRKLQ